LAAPFPRTGGLYRHPSGVGLRLICMTAQGSTRSSERFCRVLKRSQVPNDRVAGHCGRSTSFGERLVSAHSVRVPWSPPQQASNCCRRKREHRVGSKAATHEQISRSKASDDRVEPRAAGGRRRPGKALVVCVPSLAGPKRMRSCRNYFRLRVSEDLGDINRSCHVALHSFKQQTLLIIP
jgi:hypothetical protein